MKALVIADADPEVDIISVVEDKRIDIVITLGDLTTWDLKGLEKLDIPKIGVYGNHDVVKYMPDFGIMNLHCKTFEFDSRTFAGFEGCVEYRDHTLEPMYSQKEASRLIRKLPKADIFITHCPPRGINDINDIDHQGWDGLLKYVKRKKPKVLLHGHTYPTEQNLVRQYKNTRIEYVQGYRIINL
jgi:Icc-related predicted phosphoesterase